MHVVLPAASGGGTGALLDLIDYFEACGFDGQSGWLAIRWGREPDAPRAQAVLSWLVAGAVKWYANEKVMPQLPQAVIDSTTRWRGRVDQLARYIDDNLVFDPSWHVMGRRRRR